MQNAEEPSFIALMITYTLLSCLLQSGVIPHRTTTTSLFSCDVNSQMAAVQRVSFVDVNISENFPY